MRILIDARLYGLENTGIGRYVMNLVDNLTNIDTKNDYVILLRQKYFDSLTLPSNWKKVLADFHHYSLAEQIKLPGLIKSEQADVVHFPHFNVPLLFNGNFVVTIHDMLMHKSVGLSATTLSPAKYFLKRLAYRSVFDHAIKKSRKVIVPSNTVKEEISAEYKICPDKIVVTYEGFDSKIVSGKAAPKMDKPYFVFIGNAYPHKNLGNLIKAINILNNKNPQSAILAISSSRNVFTQRMKDLIEKENASKFVKLLGFVPDDALGSLLKDSSAFVFPTFSEGFGLPGLEAMNAGTLVLASDIPVLKEVYKDNAIYFDPKDPEKIADAMEQALSMQESIRLERIKKAKEFVKTYSWDKMARQTLKVYAESCNSIR